MNEITNLITALIFSGSLIFGIGLTIKTAHDYVRQEVLSQISQGLSSSEELANALTGEKLDY